MIIPFLTCAILLGFGRLMSGFSTKFTLAFGIFCIVGTTLWNVALIHGWNPKRVFSSGTGFHCCDASTDYRRSYLKLESLFRERGMGYIWPELSPQTPDPRLYPATIPMNISAQSGGKGQWFSLWLNRDEQSFLDTEWNGGEWFDLSATRFPAYGMESLVILPTPPPTVDIQKWMRFQAVFHRAMNVEFSIPEGGSVQECISLLENHRSDAKDDRFLEMIYWERLAQLYRHELRFQDDTLALEKSLEFGYPTAHVYYQLAGNYLRKRDFVNARLNFVKALNAPNNMTASAVWLDRLGYLRQHPEEFAEDRKP
jgi:hypothetical protein